MAVDYGALADQARGVDYAALAEKARAGGAVDSLPAGVPPPGEMSGPRANTERWLRVLPYVTGAGAALLTKNPRGAGMGAEIGAGLAQIIQSTGGGMAGQYLSNKLMGNPPGQGVMNAGFEQGALQIPASAVGIAGEGLLGLRQFARNVAVKKAIKETNAALTAGRAARQSGLAREIPEAISNRQSAAAATQAEIMANRQQQVRPSEIVDHIIQAREQRFGVQVSPKIRKLISRDVQSRLATVLPNYTGRLISGTRASYDLPTAQVAKQAFDDVVRSIHTGVEGGVKPKPSIDLDIADAWRSLIEQRAPAVKDLNQVTRSAIKEEQSLKKLQKASPTGSVARVRMGERDAATGAKVLAGRSANPIRLVRSIPTEGNMGMPVLGYRPGTLAELGGKIGTGLASAPAEHTSFYLPRLLALLASQHNQGQ